MLWLEYSANLNNATSQKKLVRATRNLFCFEERTWNVQASARRSDFRRIGEWVCHLIVCSDIHSVYQKIRSNASEFFKLLSINSVSLSLFFVALRPNAGRPGPPHPWGWLMTHNDASQSVGLLWTSDQLVAETSTWQHTTLTTNIHAPGGIRTHNLSKRAAADLRLRPHGYWDRLCYLISLTIS